MSAARKAPKRCSQSWSCRIEKNTERKEKVGKWEVRYTIHSGRDRCKSNWNRISWRWDLFQASVFFFRCSWCMLACLYLHILLFADKLFLPFILGSLLTRFSEKGLKYRITSNPIAKTILWTMKYPEHISEVISRNCITKLFYKVQYCVSIYVRLHFCYL